jgi:hypothetical protein
VGNFKLAVLRIFHLAVTDTYGKRYLGSAHLPNRLDEKPDISLCKGINALSEQHLFPDTEEE